MLDVLQPIDACSQTEEPRTTPRELTPSILGVYAESNIRYTHRADEAYFREQIAPLFEGPGVQFIGEINEREKTDFLGQALALMFLIDWPEPFGLSMIEAIACGTPVLALRRGSVEEVVEDGLTGHIVDSIEEATVPCRASLG